MTGGTNRGLEDLLRDRLHEVDALDPPEPDFEFRALRAGRERLKRRQSWRRGLVGAAAAVVIGALAIPALGRLDVTSSGGSSSSSGVAAPQERSAPAAPPAGGSAGDSSKNSAGGGAATTGVIGAVVPYAGTGSVDWDSPAGQSAIASVRSMLSSRYPDIFTSLSVDRSSTPPRLVVHLTRFDETALRAVVGALPPNAPLAYALSAFSAQSCAATLAQVGADRSTLQQQGYAMGSTRCDDDGRVVVQVSNLVTAEQIRALEVRYDDAVRVEQVTSTP